MYWDEPYDDYKQNPIQAESKWVNRQLNFISGNAEISRIAKNIWGQPYISIRNANDKNAKVEYIFYFSDKGSYPQQFHDARVGQSVKIRGVIYELNLKKELFGLRGETMQVLLNEPQFIDGEI